MQQSWWDAARTTILAALLLPLGLMISYSVVRIFGRLRRIRPGRATAPVVVHPLNFEHSLKDFVDGQGVQLLEIPSKVRDYLSWDSTTDVSLAPGPVGPITPQIPTVFPDAENTPASVAVQVAQLFRPRRRPKINLILVPEVPSSGFAVGVQLVKTPGDILIGARSVQATDLKELTYKVGGYCAEVVLEQPEFARRAPRWEHWTPKAYTLFRIGLYFQRHDLELAHDRLTEAARRCPGNVQIALYHGNVHEKMGEYRKAAEVYDAAACLWTSNIDLIYRLAAARANYAMAAPDLSLKQRIQLMKESNKSLEFARLKLRKPSVLKAFAATFWPFRQDQGERRYWLSWLTRASIDGRSSDAARASSFAER